MVAIFKVSILDFFFVASFATAPTCLVSKLVYKGARVPGQMVMVTCMLSYNPKVALFPLANEKQQKATHEEEVVLYPLGLTLLTPKNVHSGRKQLLHSTCLNENSLTAASQQPS